MPTVPADICFNYEAQIVYIQTLISRFETLIEEINEEHELSIELPGVPPIVFPPIPSIDIPGVPGRAFNQRFAGGQRNAAYVGHRFLQGSVGVESGLQSNIGRRGAFTVPGMSEFTIPGVDPWTEIFKWVQTVFDLIVQETQDVIEIPELQAVPTPRSCADVPTINDVIDDNIDDIEEPPEAPVIPPDPFSQRIAPWAADETSSGPIRSEFQRLLHVSPGLPITFESYSYQTVPLFGPNTLNFTDTFLDFFDGSTVGSVAFSYDVEVQPKPSLTPAQVMALAGPVLPATLNNVTMDLDRMHSFYTGSVGSFPDGTLSRFQLVFHTYDADGVFLAEQAFNVPALKDTGTDSVIFLYDAPTTGAFNGGPITTTGLSLGGKLVLMGYRMTGTVTSGATSERGLGLRVDAREIHAVP